jgi:hypothetical protein
MSRKSFNEHTFELRGPSVFLPLLVFSPLPLFVWLLVVAGCWLLLATCWLLPVAGLLGIALLGWFLVLVLLRCVSSFQPSFYKLVS